MCPHVSRRGAEEAFDACELAQLLSDPLDLGRALSAFLAELGELRASRLVVAKQLLCKRAAADLLEDPAHPLAHAVVDDARAAREVAVLGDVGHRVAHVLVPALVEEVDDELQLVQALVVGDLRLVAGLDEDVEARLHERGNAAAQHGLLAEQIALGLLREGRLQQADPAAPDADAVRERELERAAACVLLDRDEARGAGTGDVELAHAMAGSLRGDHDHVVAVRRDDPPEVDVQAVREEHRCARLEARRDLGLPYALLDMVRNEHGDDLRPADGVGDRRDLDPRFLGGCARRAPLAETDDDLDAGVVQVERVRVSLAAEADDRDLAVEKSELAVAMNGCHVFASLLVSGVQTMTCCDERGRCGRVAQARPSRPVRPSSCNPCGRTSSSKESISSGEPTSSKTIESGPRSATRAPKTSARAISSVRLLAGAATFSSASSRSTDSPGASSCTRSTFTSLCICFSICSSEWCSQSTRSVIRETSCRSVGPTARLSMLNPRRANMLVIRINAPGLFSTNTLKVCFMPLRAPPARSLHGG